MKRAGLQPHRSGWGGTLHGAHAAHSHGSSGQRITSISPVSGYRSAVYTGVESPDSIQRNVNCRQFTPTKEDASPRCPVASLCLEQCKRFYSFSSSVSSTRPPRCRVAGPTLRNPPPPTPPGPPSRSGRGGLAAGGSIGPEPSRSPLPSSTRRRRTGSSRPPILRPRDRPARLARDCQHTDPPMGRHENFLAPIASAAAAAIASTLVRPGRPQQGCSPAAGVLASALAQVRAGRASSEPTRREHDTAGRA